MNPSPAITFTVNMKPATSIVVGPNTNEVTTGVQSVDQRASDPDRGRTEATNRLSTFAGYMPSLNVCPNRTLRHGDSFTEYGLKAVYLRDMYGIGYAPAERACLTVDTVA